MPKPRHSGPRCRACDGRAVIVTPKPGAVPTRGCRDRLQSRDSDPVRVAATVRVVINRPNEGQSPPPFTLGALVPNIVEINPLVSGCPPRRRAQCRNVFLCRRSSHGCSRILIAERDLDVLARIQDSCTHTLGRARGNAADDVHSDVVLCYPDDLTTPAGFDSPRVAGADPRPSAVHESRS